MQDDEAGAAAAWMGVSYKTILTAEATGGALSVIDSLSPPGAGPPRHVHHKEDETFIILTGACDFWIEGERFRREEGETAFIPRGKEHSFRVTDNAPSRHLVIMTPGGFEGFFAEMVHAGYRIPEDMAQIGESAARHHLSFTGPPIEPY